MIKSTKDLYDSEKIDINIKITGDNMAKLYNPHHDNAKNASIDKDVAKEYMKYMDKDNQNMMLVQHEKAAHRAYVSFYDSLKGMDIPDYGEEIKDDDKVLDILAEYVVNLADKIHPYHKIKKRYKALGEMDMDEKTREISLISENYLGLKAQNILQFKEVIKRNEGFTRILNEKIGGHIQRGNVLKYLNQKLYDQTFNKLEYFTEGTLAEWLKDQDNFEPYTFKKGKEMHLTPDKARTLIDLIAQDEKLEDDFLDDYGIMKRPVKYKDVDKQVLDDEEDKETDDKEKELKEREQNLADKIDELDN